MHINHFDLKDSEGPVVADHARDNLLDKVIGAEAVEDYTTNVVALLEPSYAFQIRNFTVSFSLYGLLIANPVNFCMSR